MAGMKRFKTLFIVLSFTLMSSAIADVEPYRKHSTDIHKMRIINSGMGALYARVDMIRRAKKSIDMESYIFNDDTAGKIILRELAAAAKRGVKVRLLVDKFGSRNLDEYNASILKENGVDVRYYNSASILNLSTFQSRNHRKLLVKDGEEAITGGRNVADQYFDISKEYNFLDRDATIEGSIVSSMQESFDKYWHSKMSSVPREPELPVRRLDQQETHYRMKARKHKKRLEESKHLLDSNPEIERVLAFMEKDGKEMFLASEKRDCPEVSFASDREDGGFKARLKAGSYSKDYRYLRQEIASWIDRKAKDEIIIDTPYFLENYMSERLSMFLKETGTNLKVMTNSLASTDSVFTQTVFSDQVKSYTKFPEFKAYLFNGIYPGETKLLEGVEDATWGTHSKTIIFSKDSFMIGSFNMDNRSSYYNSELAIFCSGSEELTKDVRDSIEGRMKESHRLDKHGDIEVCEDEALTISPLKKSLFWLLKIPSHLLQDLL